MFTTIVVGTDGSRTARRAVTVAAELARRFDARLHVVHGYHDPSTGPGGSRQAGGSMWHQAGEAVLEDALADQVLEGVRAEGHSVDGAAHEAILAVARETGADLIVVGNRGMYGPQSPAGSVPDHVVRSSPCHVLVAKTT